MAAPPTASLADSLAVIASCDRWQALSYDDKAALAVALHVQMLDSWCARGAPAPAPAGQTYTQPSSYLNGPTLLLAGVALAVGWFLGRRA